MADPWSWKTVFETLSATAAGACVGVGGIWWQFHRESKERYEGRLIDALADILKEISVYAKFSKSTIVTESGRGDFALLAAIDIAEMVARDEDLKMIEAIKRAALTDRQIPNERLQLKLGILSSGISDWRSKRRPFDRCYREIQGWATSKEPETD